MIPKLRRDMRVTVLGETQSVRRSHYPEPFVETAVIRTFVRTVEDHHFVDCEGRRFAIREQGKTWACGWTTMGAEALEVAFSLGAPK